MRTEEIAVRSYSPDPNTALASALKKMNEQIVQLEQDDHSDRVKRRRTARDVAKRLQQKAHARGDDTRAAQIGRWIRDDEPDRMRGWVTDRTRTIETIVVDGVLSTVVTIVATVQLRND